MMLIIPNIQFSHSLTVSQCATALPGSSDITDTGTENSVESAHSPDRDTGHNWSVDYSEWSHLTPHINTSHLIPP